MIDRVQLIRDVARRTGVRLNPADPALDLAEICDAALLGTVKTIEQLTKAQAAASAQSVLDAKRQGELMITEGAEWLRTQLHETAKEAASIVLTELRKETAKAEAASRVASHAAWWTASAAALAALGVIGMMTVTMIPMR